MTDILTTEPTSTGSTEDSACGHPSKAIRSNVGTRLLAKQTRTYFTTDCSFWITRENHRKKRNSTTRAHTFSPSGYLVMSILPNFKLPNVYLQQKYIHGKNYDSVGIINNDSPHTEYQLLQKNWYTFENETAISIVVGGFVS